MADPPDSGEAKICKDCQHATMVRTADVSRTTISILTDGAVTEYTLKEGWTCSACGCIEIIATRRSATRR